MLKASSVHVHIPFLMLVLTQRKFQRKKGDRLLYISLLRRHPTQGSGLQGSGGHQIAGLMDAFLGVSSCCFHQADSVAG